jgi:hypothetical protein
MPVENLWNAWWLAVPQAASKTRFDEGVAPRYARFGPHRWQQQAWLSARKEVSRA